MGDAGELKDEVHHTRFPADTRKLELILRIRHHKEKGSPWHTSNVGDYTWTYTASRNLERR